MQTAFTTTLLLTLTLTLSLFPMTLSFAVASPRFLRTTTSFGRSLFSSTTAVRAGAQAQFIQDSILNNDVVVFSKSYW